jgi:hypothetical protein
MARTYISATTSRSEVTRTNPTDAHIRGWDAGVRVEVRTDENGRDEFLIYMTSGSNGRTADQLAGVVTDTPDGPVWHNAALAIAGLTR